LHAPRLIALDERLSAVDRAPREKALEDRAPLAAVDRPRHPAVFLTHLELVLVEALFRRAEDPQVDVDEDLLVF
jgi:hypothetical protein